MKYGKSKGAKVMVKETKTPKTKTVKVKVSMPKKKMK